MHSVHKMRPIATDGVAIGLTDWTDCLCICLLVTFMNLAKTAESIAMPIGG